MGVAVSRPFPKSNPALPTDLEPVYVRLLLRFEAIRATAKHHRTSSPQPAKSAIVEAVAHLAIELLERYSLKEASEVEKRRVERHVASCPKCEFILEEHLAWVAAMRSPFRRMVEKMIEDERKKRRKAGTEVMGTSSGANPDQSHEQIPKGGSSS